jgi:hypothetical protein
MAAAIWSTDQIFAQLFWFMAGQPRSHIRADIFTHDQNQELRP